MRANTRIRRESLGVLLAAVATAFVLVGCGSSTGATPDTQLATQFFRQAAADHYHGKVALGDGRGCAQNTPTKWTCTAYVRNPKLPDTNIDVFGIVTAKGTDMHVSAGLARDGQIQRWFLRTNGGCKTNSCKGTTEPLR